MEFYLRYETGRRRNECKACCRARDRRHRAENIEQHRARDRARHAADPERRRAYARQWAAANAERCRARAREWYANHRARHREGARRWVQRHPEQVREHRRRYVGRYPRREIVRQVSRGLVKLGIIQVGDRCEGCGSPVFELHHPDYSNPFWVVPLCRACHSALHWAIWWREGGGPVKYPEEYRDGG